MECRLFLDVVVGEGALGGEVLACVDKPEVLFWEGRSNGEEGCKILY